MVAAYAALVSLLNLVQRFQRQIFIPVPLDQMESLPEIVCFFIDLLESESQGNRQEAKEFENRIAELAYDAERIIERHVETSIKASMGEQIEIPHFNIERVIVMMDMLIKNKSLRGTADVVQPSTFELSSYIPTGMITIVGLDDDLIQIMERLTGHQSGRQIIPITGMGGIGKTTLAKTIYDSPAIVQHFHIRAWVSISQEYICRQIILGLFRHVKDVKDGDLTTFMNDTSQMSEEQLGERLYRSLCGMRYLVVLDDVWSLEAWENVRRYIPDNSNGSRIIVTTRLSSVATHFDSCGFRMSFLDEDKSWNLLREKVFAREGCPLELEEVGREIAKNCKGLPLSIVVIGGLLAKSGKTKSYWEYVARDTHSLINLEGDEHCVRIISLSYDNLPIHLKPCFLYMGVFPEDEEIRVSWPINLWVAEGFLKPNGSKDAEVIGREYLNDLISRNLIFVCKFGSDGTVRLCYMHDLVRDICLREAHEEKFIHVQSLNSHYYSSEGGYFIHRRTSVHRRSSKEKHVSELLKSLSSNSYWGVRSFISDLDGILPLQRSKMLRVLKAADKYMYIHDKVGNRYLLDDFSQVINIRFIAVRGVRGSSSSLRLWNLQILIFQEISKFVAPFAIWEMAELRHLEFQRGVYLPDPPNQHTADRKDYVALVNLQTMIGVKNFRCSDEVVKRIPNIKKLKISYENTAGESEEYCLTNLTLLKKLESFVCSFYCGREMADQISNLTFPSSLKKLRLFGSELHWKDMTKIGSLPQLEVLKLEALSFIGPDWIPVEGEFGRLKFLRVDSLRELENWMAESTHFPCLEHLVLKSLDNLLEIPSGIGDIPTLKSILVEFCSDSVVISAKRTLEEQEDIGNFGLQVRVICKKSVELERLASDNFQVRSLGT